MAVWFEAVLDYYKKYKWSASQRPPVSIAILTLGMGGGERTQVLKNCTAEKLAILCWISVVQSQGAKRPPVT